MEKHDSVFYELTINRKYILFLLIINFSFLKANNLPVNIGADTTLCEGQSLLLSAPLLGDSLSYSWSTGDTTQNINVDTAGIYSVIVTSPNCIGFDTIDVNFITGPDVSISADDVCFGTSTLFVSNSNHDTNASYVWDFGDGQMSSLIIDTLLHDYGINGQSYTASLTILNGNGCLSSDTIIVESLLNPSVEFIIDPVCLNIASSIINNSESVFNDAIVTIYYGNGDSLLTSNQTTYSILYEDSQTYNVIVEVDNNNGCTGTQALSAIVYSLPQTSLSGVDSTYCQGNELDTLIGLPAGGTFSGINVENGMGSAVSIGFFTPLQQGQNIPITYTFIDSNGCVGISEEEITNVFEHTEISFLVEDSLYCIGNSSDTLTVNFLGGNFSGDFLTIDPTLPSNMIVFTPTEIGMYQIAYTAIDANGCETNTNQNLIVGGVSYIDLPSEASIVSGESLILTLGQENPAYSYLWSNGETGSFIEIQNPGFYIVTITDLATGCFESDTVFVNLSTSIAQINFLSDLKIFPNPVYHEINVSFTSQVNEETDIIILNSIGNSVFEKRFNMHVDEFYSFIVPVIHLPSGVYFLKIGEFISLNPIIKIK